ncbi:unnamed protein product [Victoria cruziana]
MPFHHRGLCLLLFLRQKWTETINSRIPQPLLHQGESGSIRGIGLCFWFLGKVVCGWTMGAGIHLGGPLGSDT